MPPTHKIPSIDSTSFNCPHCGALTSQTWFDVYAVDLGKALPDFWTEEKVAKHIESIREDSHFNEDFKRDLELSTLELNTGLPRIWKSSDWMSCDYHADNIWFSKCYNCQKIAVWIYNKLVCPPDLSDAPAPNEDLSEEILTDYREAASILSRSPRGSAALLRLCIQKLCGELGETGDNLNGDIARLVKTGLDPRVQKSLDSVRVIGNNAVHPGLIDLKDDQKTASKLFALVNLIAEIMISQPKHVIDAVYDTLPESEKQKIAKRDSKAA